MNLSAPVEFCGQDNYSIISKFHSKISILAYCIVVFITVIIVSILNFFKGENGNDTSTSLTIINQQVIENNQKALEELHRASDKCYKKDYVVKCIDIATRYPYLIDVTLPNSNGITPFHRVCYRGNYDLIECMIAEGADLSKTTDYGENCFHMAIDYYIRNPTKRQFKCLDLLYRNGCFLKKNSEWYKKFVSYAKEEENEDLVQWLESHSTPINKKSE